MSLTRLRPAARYCPRCGAFYPSLKSDTCPQCFAKVAIVDEDTTRQLAQIEAAQGDDPEYVAQKARDDERFKEQSFGACLTVILILISTIVCAAVIISIASRSHRKPIGLVSERNAMLTTTTVTNIASLFPLGLNGLARISVDKPLSIEGVSIPMYCADYARGVQVYCLPGSDVGLSDQKAFYANVDAAAHSRYPPLAQEEIEKQSEHYGVLAPSADLLAQADSGLRR